MKKKSYAMAVQITRDTFDSPRDDHVPSVQYSPQHRCAFVPTDMGLTAAGIGDWIVREANGKLAVYGDEDFKAVYGAGE